MIQNGGFLIELGLGCCWEGLDMIWRHHEEIQSWMYRAVVWGGNQGEEVRGWEKGIRIKGEKIKETEGKRGRKMNQIRQKTREFGKRYDKKKVNRKLMKVRKIKQKMRNNKLNKKRTVGDVRLSSSIICTCMAWRSLQGVWPYRATKERRWESSACKSHAPCSDKLPPATHWGRMKCVCNNRTQ